jgi:hypothetical protein
MKRLVDIFGEDFRPDMKDGWKYFEHVYQSSFVHLVTS